MATAAMARTLTQTVKAEPTLQMRLQIPHAPQKNDPLGNTKLRNRLRLDPSRALEPARKKIATIEAQRIMSVFEDTIAKSEIVTLLPFIIDNLDRFSVSLGTELYDLITNHAVILGSYHEIKQSLEKQMRRNAQAAKKRQRTPSQASEDPEGNQMLDEDDAAAAIVDTSSGTQSRERTPQSSRSLSRQTMSRQDSRSSSRPTSADSRASSARSMVSNFSMDSQMERTVRSLSNVAQQLNSSCKNILRSFHVNPSALNTIKHEYAKRHPVCQDLITNMSELKDILMNKLLTTPEEENERMAYLQEISKRERNNAAVIDKLETELKAAQDDKDDEVS